MQINMRESLLMIINLDMECLHGNWEISIEGISLM